MWLIRNYGNPNIFSVCGIAISFERSKNLRRTTSKKIAMALEKFPELRVTRRATLPGEKEDIIIEKKKVADVEDEVPSDEQIRVVEPEIVETEGVAGDNQYVSMDALVDEAQTDKKEDGIKKGKRAYNKKQSITKEVVEQTDTQVNEEEEK